MKMILEYIPRVKEMIAPTLCSIVLASNLDATRMAYMNVAAIFAYLITYRSEIYQN